MGANKRESDLNYQMITTNDELASLCEVTRDFPAIALDAEFVRTRTYYPQLGLIQMYDGKHVSLIDPLGITDWTPMRDLLLDTAVSSGRGRGRINLDGETIALTITGAAKGDPFLKLVDPLSVGGTLSVPTIAIDGAAQKSGKPGGGIVLRVEPGQLVLDVVEARLGVALGRFGARAGRRDDGR